MNRPSDNFNKEFLNYANKVLQEQLNLSQQREKENMDILRAFGLEELFTDTSMDDFEDQYVRQAVCEETKKQSDKYFTSNLDTKISNLRSIFLSTKKYKEFAEKVLEKYKSTYQAIKSEDVIDIKQYCESLNPLSVEASNVDGLSPGIEINGEQQVQNQDMIAKFRECCQLKKKIVECKKEDDMLKKNLVCYSGLPPNLDNAQEKLNKLKEEFRKIDAEFKGAIFDEETN